MNELIKLLQLINKKLIIGGIVAFSILCFNYAHSDEPLSSEQVQSLCDKSKSMYFVSKKLQKKSPSLDKCNSELLYYGVRTKENDVHARYCATFHENYSILTMIYANGRGAKKNLDTALYFACRLDDSTFDRDVVIHNILLMKKNTVLKKELDVYDYVTPQSGVIEYYSLIIYLDNHEEKKYTQKFLNQFTPLETSLYKKMKKASLNYFDVRIDSEITQRAWMVLDEEMNLARNRVHLLKKITSCNTMQFNEAEYLVLDSKLNTLYKKIMHAPADKLYSPKKDIKRTEQAWVNYKISMEKLGQLRCPHINQFTWGMILTQQRLEQLEQLIQG